MAGEIEGRTVPVLATEGVKQVEPTDPRIAVEHEGGCKGAT